jgi:hypothetical protein
VHLERPDAWLAEVESFLGGDDVAAAVPGGVALSA